MFGIPPYIRIRTVLLLVIFPLILQLEINIRPNKIEDAMNNRMHIPRSLDQTTWTSEQFCDWFMYSIIHDDFIKQEEKRRKHEEKEKSKKSKETNSDWF